MKKEETKIVDLYDLSHTQAADFLRQFTYPWEALAHIKEFILELGKTLPDMLETVWETAKGDAECAQFHKTQRSARSVSLAAVFAKLIENAFGLVQP